VLILLQPDSSEIDPFDSMRSISKSHAKQLNLKIIATDASVTNYLPIHLKTNTALIIEDNDLAEAVIEQMLKSGVSIIELTEVD
jgi:hypothetical protein